MKRILCICLLLGCLVPRAAAMELDSGDVFCFAAENFGDTARLTGICITRLPEAGCVMLGDRCLRPGDVLTAAQIPEMVFVSEHGEQDAVTSIGYLPVFAGRVSDEAVLTLSIRGRENKAPIAEDTAFETYKNLELDEKLRVKDPEAQTMTFSVIRQPKRGSVMIHEDGSFTYTPKKNKVGVDSFTYTASDPAGKVSREATVTITIVKPTDARQYTDTAGKRCRFAAEWMKNTGIFTGETLDGNPCFSPDRPVTRGEFLTMLVKTLKEPVDASVQVTGYRDVPGWLRPYLAAAVRSGLTAKLPARDSFGSEEWITPQEAAALLCSALSLEAMDRPALYEEGSESFDALSTAAENGFLFENTDCVTRGEAAQLLYQTARFRGDISLPRVIN